MHRILVANRGEIAVRITRSVQALGLQAVAVYSEDDSDGLHLRLADSKHPLAGAGPGAYLDSARIVQAARDCDCDAIHPGYGFLSERADFARACTDADIVFIGPDIAALEQLGDKARARALAVSCQVPVLAGTEGATSLEQAQAFMGELAPGTGIMIKAVFGGGGRGMRPVTEATDLPEAYTRCASEAERAFGSGDLYIEQLLPRARHIEVQIVGDGSEVIHLGERECSLQRRRQKLVETSPALYLCAEMREQITAAALRIGGALSYRGLGTIEFLVTDDDNFVFIEANARLQVEHTVTEQVIGLDLVALQLALAGGTSLADLGLEQSPTPRGCAIQVRINAETIAADGSLQPGGGTLTAFQPPSGPGLRTDSCGYPGYTTNPAFDSLLAKLICHEPSRSAEVLMRRARRALEEFQIEGIVTNKPLMLSILSDPDVLAGRIHTQFLDEAMARLAAASEPTPVGTAHLAGARLDTDDPLAILAHGNSPVATPVPSPPAPQPVSTVTGPPGTNPVAAPLQGTIVSLAVAEGDAVFAGQQLLVMESMKMEHPVPAPCSGEVRALVVTEGDAVCAGTALLFIAPGDVEISAAEHAQQPDPSRIRPDLAEVLHRLQFGQDEARPEAVARRRKTGQRTARENIEDLVDAGTFTEYGALVIAAQRLRRPVEELIERTPADGLIAGIGSINSALFPDSDSRCILMSYDYTVLAGTQGKQNHHKKDRMFELAEQWRLPIVFFTEGGGGRPGDTDSLGVAGLDCMAFNYFARLSGLVPLIGITSGRCFAGNAALLGCCDLVIATEGSNIGMGGPAMIEGGGLGMFRPEEIGPLEVQRANGVVDIAVSDEAEAVAVARSYLSYFQGITSDWACADQRLLRTCIPENRLRIYDLRTLIKTLVDTDSLLELRRDFGHGMITALARIEGRPLGIVANNPAHLSGAIDSAAADKAARFMQLCDAFDIPLLFLCDTPGIMVGPEVEKTGLVRHAARMFITGASLSVPFFTIVLRKSYGLGAQAMAGGSFKIPMFAISWPTGEFGGMGLEGAVKLGYRKELDAIENPAERKRTYQEMVDRMYERGKAVNVASHFELDAVIDPAESRHWILRALRTAPDPAPRTGKKRPCIDSW